MAGLKIFKLQQLLSILFSILNIILFGGYFFIKVYVSPTVQIQFNDFLYFYTFTQIIILIITLYFFFKETPISFNISFLNFKDFKFLIAFSLTAYLANLFQFLTYKIDISFVDFYLGKSQLGVYSLATNLTRMFWVLPVSISTILIPYNATDELSRSTININKLTRTTIFMIVVIIAFSLPLIDLFIPFIYGNEFSEASTILKILIFGLIPFAATNIVLSFFSGRGLVKHNLIFAFIVFILTITGDYFLINSFGTVGASITNVLSYTLGFIYPLVIYINYTNASLSDLLIVKKLDFVEVKKKLSANLKLNIFKTPK